jgi:hypothetical protein
MAGSIKSNMLNQGGADPRQGFDVGCWVADQSSGGKVLLGQFTSIVMTVRNATEIYLEMGQRYPRYLDGEFQIAYVLEKGLLDVNVFQQTFGFNQITRRKRFGRSPRFEITFSMNPVDADVLEGAISSIDIDGTWNRDVTGRFVLETCKIDSWHLAATSGRHVVAVQWQGVAEGFTAITSDYSIIDGLKTPTLSNDTPAKNIGGQGNFFKSFQDGVANTIPGTQPNLTNFS